jgi:hypothetical protein
MMVDMMTAPTMSARHDGDDQPEGEFAHIAEHQEDADQQQLVRHRVEIGAELGFLVEMAGDEAVDPIRYAGDQETGERPFHAVREQREHDARHQEEAQQGDDVGYGHVIMAPRR